MDVERLADEDGEGRGVLFGGDPKVVHLRLEAGESVPPHRHPGETVVFHVLDGEFALTVGEATERLSAGAVARFDGAQDISPSAETDAEALLVLASD
jgi:quercetin dioxygenase-like cupin family protein